MRPRLKPIADQIIVITGASSGIGLATAREAARRGAAVVLVARNEDALQAIARELREDGARVEVCVLDVADKDAAERIADTAISGFGGFDTWVNCAAVSDYGSLEEIGLNEHLRVFEVNYFGVLECCLLALKHLRTRGGGAIINLGSILSDRALIEQGPYSATKHAVRALTETLRMDIDREGLPISVTLIKPGGVHTPFPEHARNHMEAPPRVPQMIYAPELVADAILFAAEHPRRQLYVGGNGFLLSTIARLLPRPTDRIMELFFVRAQQSPEHPGDPAARDNLYEPKKDGREEGSQPFFVRRSSLWLEAQKRPVVSLALAGLGTLAAATLLRQQRGSDRSSGRRKETPSKPARPGSGRTEREARRPRASSRGQS